jgi:uncharacterized protein YqgC (DUF456 family)
MILAGFSIPYWDFLYVLTAMLLLVLIFVFWLLNLLNLPGNWMMSVATLVYMPLIPEDSRLAVTWPVVVALLLLATWGELVEFAASVWGVTKAGGTRWGAGLALIGSIAGGIAGVFFGLPIPILGQILAAVLFAGLGALVGAVVGERIAGRQFPESMRVGRAAFWGRLLGTLGKVGVGAVMGMLVLISLSTKLF